MPVYWFIVFRYIVGTVDWTLLSMIVFASYGFALLGERTGILHLGL